MQAQREEEERKLRAEEDEKRAKELAEEQKNAPAADAVAAEEPIAKPENTN